MWLYLLGTVFVLAVLIAAMFWLPQIIAQHDIGSHAFRTLDGDKRGSEVNSVRTTLLQALAGVVLVIGAVFTLRQLQISKEGQVTDRYTRAIDQLGSPVSDVVRIGGIYALERIAKDSQEDRRTIVAVLGAFVRAHAPLSSGVAGAAPKSQPAKRLRERAADVQTALAVLGRLPLPKGFVINLTLTDLDGADLVGAKFAGADLVGANLAHAHLEGADLTDAKLVGAHLEGAKLNGAHLDSADLTGAHLEGADLDHATLRGSPASRAKDLKFPGAKLWDAHLENATLNYADLTGAYLLAVHFNDSTYLAFAKLSGAYLGRAEFNGAHCYQVHLDGADLTGAKVSTTPGNERLVTRSDLPDVEGLRTAIGPDGVMGSLA